MNIIYLSEYKKQRKLKTMPELTANFQMKNQQKIPNGNDSIVAESVIEKIKQIQSGELIITMDELINDILEIQKSDSKINADPFTHIVKIVEKLHFQVHQRMLPKWISGYIHINKKYNKKSIVVNSRVEFHQQRFVIAHELAHFIYDYKGTPKYIDTYRKNNHGTLKEKRANTFAAKLLMPKDKFEEKYFITKDENKNSIFIVYRLAKVFKVQPKAINKRLYEVIY